MKAFWIMGRVIVGFIFAYAGFNKLLDPVENFQAILANYALIPAFTISTLAHLLPWFEWIGGCFLIAGYAPRPTILILASFTLVFLASLITNFILSGGMVRDCGCFGEHGFHLSAVQMMAIDIFNLMILASLFFSRHLPWSLHNWLERKEALKNAQMAMQDKHHKEKKR